MFAEFIKRLTQPDPAQLPDGDARLALTALLVRIAKSDNEYAPSERARIDQIIAKRYALDADGTASLRADAEALEAEAPDTVRFTRAIKGAVDLEERSAVIEALWSVVLVDGERDAQEDSLLRLLANLLCINDRDSNIARKRAEEAIHPRNSQA